MRRKPIANSCVYPDTSTVGECNSLFGSSKSKVSTGSGPSRGNKKPIPTALELGALQGGAIHCNLRANADEAHEAENEDCVEEKLVEAKCLREARNLGMGREFVLLRDFQQNGGAQHVAQELVRLLPASSATHHVRVQKFTEILTPFCERFAVSDEKAMLDCTAVLCRRKNVSARAIEESCSIARCCSTVTGRCHIALAVLCAALLCG